MEGLIPFVYKAIVQYRNCGQVSLGSLLFDHEPPPSYYMRLPGDSGRFQSTEIQLLSSPPTTTSTTGSLAPQQSPIRRSTSRRQIK
ncbi:uncharacterized protein LOC144549542 [Carex rostrata]